MAVYTKTGDKGETSLFSADPTKKIRISKSSQRIKTIGAVDEINSFLGLSIPFLEDKKLILILQDVQRSLFTIGSILAGAKLRFLSSKTRKLELQIDRWEENIPVLKNFILPGGEKSAGFIFYSRTLARRAERELATLSQDEKVHPEILKFINRLSDFLFIMARFINCSAGVKEELWSGKKPSKK